MDVEAIDGVGAKTAERLGDLDDPERALRDGDVATLARAPGISSSRAARLAPAAIRHRHDESGDFLATDRAREIYRDALGLLQERAVTDYATHRVETFYPSNAESRITEVREFVAAAMERDPDPEVLDALSGVEPLEAPTGLRVRERCLATVDAERYAAAEEAVPELSVEIVETGEDLAELARGYATVIALDERFAGIDVPGDVQVRPDALDAPETVVPERTLAFFARNRKRLLAAAEVHRASDAVGNGERHQAPACDLDALEDSLSRLDTDGTIAGDAELRRLQRAVNDLSAAVSTAESVANDRLREAIAERDVTIEGADLLSLVEQGAGVDSLLSTELADEHADAVAAAREHLIDALDLDSGENEIARGAFSEEPTYPVEREEDVVSRLEEELTAERDRRAVRLKRDLAEDLAALRPDAEQLVADALERDVELAVARFADDFECVLPDFGGSGVAIEGGRSPLLDVPFEAVEPVEYSVSGVTLLSGVNSGGKTSVLDLLGLVVVLGHMGLPVPAESARIERVGSLHYQAKSQGTLDAGAFESTLREFAGLVGGADGEDEGDDEDGSDEGEGSGGRLVLVDELESITEPGASARIIAGILEALDGSATTAVFVSHLAGEIREAAGFEVPVDGIEAEGLVDGELRVNRSPQKDVLARSTPELIVEKLATQDESEAGDGKGPFYERLLEKFE